MSPQTASTPESKGDDEKNVDSPHRHVKDHGLLTNKEPWNETHNPVPRLIKSTLRSNTIKLLL